MDLTEKKQALSVILTDKLRKLSIRSLLKEKHSLSPYSSAKVSSMEITDVEIGYDDKWPLMRMQLLFKGEKKDRTIVLHFYEWHPCAVVEDAYYTEYDPFKPRIHFEHAHDNPFYNAVVELVQQSDFLVCIQKETGFPFYSKIEICSI